MFNARDARRLRIPASAIQAFSCHFRYATLEYDFPTPLLHSTRLRDLDVNLREPMAVKYLTLMNPQLETLKVWIDREIDVVSLSSILEPLANLTRLDLCNANDVCVHEILEPVSHLRKLRHLRLYDFSDLHAVNTLDPLHLSITKLVLSSEWNENTGLSDVVRHCPHLESLTIRVVFTQDDDDFIAALSRNLREHCPQLNSIQQDYDPDCARSHLEEADHLNLLSSTKRLAHYNIPISDFNPVFCDALLSHAPWLETVKIFTYDVSEENFKNAVRILSSCPSLTTFCLDNSYTNYLPETCLALFVMPWNCPNLKNLVLNGFWIPDKKGLRERITNVLLEQVDQEDRHWHGGSREGTLDSASEDGSQDDAQAGSPPLISPWTRLLACHPPIDEKFYQKLASSGWTPQDWDEQAWDKVEKSASRLDKIVHEKVFERSSGS
ncbi:hypothetical protein BG005_010651 [Podila minutissima]|nr:hypothetical protein BG005_010651 [Podila minutissima]